VSVSQSAHRREPGQSLSFCASLIPQARLATLPLQPSGPEACRPTDIMTMYIMTMIDRKHPLESVGLAAAIDCAADRSLELSLGRTSNFLEKPHGYFLDDLERDGSMSDPKGGEVRAW